MARFIVEIPELQSADRIKWHAARQSKWRAFYPRHS
jgi:hypothetical protein